MVLGLYSHDTDKETEAIEIVLFSKNSDSKSKPSPSY